MKKDILAEAIGRIDEKYTDRAAESFESGRKGSNIIEVSFSGRPAPIRKRSKAEKILTGAAGIAAAAAVVVGTVFFADFVSKSKVQTGSGKESSPSIACKPEFTEDYKAGVFFLPADSAALSGGNIYNGGELFYINNTSTDTNVQDIAVYDSRGFYLDTYTNLNSSLECEKNESYYFRMFFTERGPIGVRCSVTKSGEDCYSSARKIYFYNDKLKITGTADIPAYENEGKFEGYYLWSFSENGKYFVEAVMNTAEGLKYSLRAFSLENGAKLLFEIPDTREIPCVGENGEKYIFNQFVALNISNDGKTIQTFNNELIDGGSQLSTFSVGYIDISGKEPTAKIAGFCGGTSGVIFDEADSITHVDGNIVDYYAFDEILHINLPLSEKEKVVTASLSPDRNYLAASVTDTETGKAYVRAFKGEGEDKELIYEQPCNSLPTRVEINDKGTVIAVDLAGNRSVYNAEMTRADNEVNKEMSGMSESIGGIAFEKTDEPVISGDYIYSGLSEKGVQRWYASSLCDTSESNMIMSKNIESGIPAYEGLMNNDKCVISVYEKPDVYTPSSYIGSYNTTKTMAEYREENNFTFTLSFTEKGIAAIKQVYGDKNYLSKITVTFFDDNMNPVTETVLPDNLVPQGEQSAYLCLSHNGRYLLINSSQKYVVFDLEEGQIIFNAAVTAEFPEGADEPGGFVPVAVSNNGDKVIARATCEVSDDGFPAKVYYPVVTLRDNGYSVEDGKVYDLSAPVKASDTAVINIEDCCFYYTSFESSKQVHLELEEKEKIKLVSVSPDESYFIAVILDTETNEEQHRVYKGLPMGGETVSNLTAKDPISVTAVNDSGYVISTLKDEE
ncbi:MAG: hypothetical protein ACI4J7_14150 [Ruminiclostridium sp.]